MATVTQIANRVSRTTGWATTAATTERDMVLEFLNEIYQDACDRTECTKTTSASADLTAGTWQYTLASSPFSLSNISRIESVYGNDNFKLEEKSAPWLREQRSGYSPSSERPVYYSTPAPGTIWFHPPPSSGSTIEIDYLKTPLVLVESGASANVSESTPTAFPSRFHFPILSNGAIAMALDGDQRKDSGPWWERYEIAVDKLSTWVQEYGGLNFVQPHFGSNNYRHSTDRSVDLP